MRWGGPPTLIPDGGNVFYTEYHTRSPVEAIAHGLSVIEGCPIEDIPPLYEYVNPDSINRIMENAYDSDRNVTVHVTIEEYNVSVESDGTISIHDFNSDADAAESE